MSKLINTLISVGLLSISMVTLSTKPANAAFFKGLGSYTSYPYSVATGVSADGSVVVGSTYADSGSDLSKSKAVRWQNGIIQDLGTLPGGSNPNVDGPGATGVSADGSVVVGYSQSNNGLRAFRWQNDVIQDLGVLPHSGCTGSQAFAVSGSGAVVAGVCYTFEGKLAFRWQNGIMQAIGSGFAYGVSEDGSVVVGQINDSEVFRWQNGIIQDLGNGSAQDVSGDGSVVVGYLGPYQDAGRAFRWQDGTMQDLGILPGDNHSVAYGTSADGSIIVGYSSNSSDDRAFIWDSTNNIRSLQDVLVKKYGLGESLVGWKLTRAEAISLDETTIVGSGLNPEGRPEAWIASLNTSAVPEPFSILGSATALGFGTFFKRKLSQKQGEKKSKVSLINLS